MGFERPTIARHLRASSEREAGDSLAGMKRHFVQLAYRAGTLCAHCRCGWEGTGYQVRAVGSYQAVWAAERDASSHEAEQGQSAQKAVNQ